MTVTRQVYVGIVEGGRESGYSLFFPDVPGCVTAADTISELAAMAREALAFHIEGLAEDGLLPPTPSDPEAIVLDADIVEAGRMFVEVDFSDEPVRVNVSFPASLLGRIDRAASERGLTRSGFLAEGVKVLLKAG